MGNYVSALKQLTLPSNDYVLVIPGWYPTWVDPMPGDFNQRHVKAASIYKPQVVLFIGKDQSGTIKNIQVKYHQLSERVAEIIILYPAEKVKAWDVIQSNIFFIKLLYQYAELISYHFGKPQLLHAYIVMRGGLGAWLLSKKWKLSFILTENWTIYYPEDPGFFKKRNWIFRTIVRTIFKSVKRFLPVTNDLKHVVHNLFGNIDSTIIPNVVETDKFYFRDSDKSNKEFVFVHVSTMVYQKNPEGLLKAFSEFIKERENIKLLMVGPYPSKVKAFADSLHLNNKVEFTGAVNYDKVASILQRANALLLFSRYENLPCVILEAHCCGLPVISTAVGGIREVIDPSNGILIDNGNEDQLITAFNNVFEKYHEYDRKKIAETAMNRFSYHAVGKRIYDVYVELGAG